MKRIVFISHSSADFPIAERLCAYLEQNGVPCWMAPRDVMPGKNYGACIIDAIDECRVFVLILSSHSNKSRQVVREVERAASTDSVILPFRIEDVQPSRDIAFYVSAAHWLDAAKYPVDEQFDELLAAIQDWQKAASGGEGGVAPPPLPSPPTQPSPPLVPGPASPKPRPFPWWLFLLAAAVLMLVGAVIFFAVTTKAPYAPGSQLASPTPSPTETPVPTPEATVTPEPSPTVTPTPVETASPMVSATATPIRRKPGERLRPMATPAEEAAEMTAPPPPPAETPPVAASAAPPKPMVRETAASSQLGKEFRPNLAFDGNPATGWVPKGAGPEQSLFANFKAPALVKSVSILNGSGRDEEHYRAANRVKTLRIILSDGTNQLLTFKDEMRMQRFELEHPVTASWAKFEIVSVFSGSKTNHAGIAEIVFNEP